MRAPVVLLLLLLVAVPAAIYLLPGSDPAEPAGAAEGAGEGGAAAAEEALPDAAPGLNGTDAAAREGAAKGLLVRVVGPDGSLAGASRLLVREAGELRAFERADGRLVLPRSEDSLELAAFHGGLWSGIRRVEAAERARAEEVVVRAEHAAASFELAVTGPDGAPAAAFHAALVWTGAAAEGTRTGLLATADDPGRDGTGGGLRWEGLPPGEYSLRVGAEGSPTVRRPLVLAAGAHERVRVDLSTGAWLSGEVRGADGAPLDGARVFVMPAFARDLRGMVSSERWIDLAPPDGITRTGEDGRFRLGPLEAAPFHVVAHAPGHLAGGPDEAVGLTPGAQIDLGAIRLEAGRALLVRVLAAENRQPLPGLRLRYLSGTPDANLLSGLIPWEQAAEATDEAGRVRGDGLPPRAVTVQADAEGRAQTRALVPADQGEEEAFELLIPLGMELRGVVLDDRDGSPVAGAELRVLSPDGGMFERLFAGQGSGEGRLRAVSGEDGRFVLAGLRPGSWQLLVDAEGFAPAATEPVPLRAGALPPEQTIRLKQGAELLVTVLDEQDQPMPGVVLTINAIDAEGGPQGERTDDQGQRRFEHLSAGTYQVQAIRTDLEGLAGMAGGDLGGLRTMADFVQLEDGDRAELVLGGRADTVDLQGYLTCGDEIVSGVNVLLVSLQGTRVATSDDIGYYEFDAVREGDYMIMVGTVGIGGGSGYTTSIHVSGTGVRQHDIELPMTRLQVRVTGREDGKALGSIPVMVRREDGSQGGGMQLSSPLGTTEFRFLAPGRYVVSVGRAAMPLFGGGGGVESRLLETVELAEGQTLPLEVALGRGAEVVVRVLDAAGSPVSGAGVFALGPEGQPLTVFNMNGTGADGTMRLGSLPAGRQRLLARHPQFGQVEREVFLDPARPTEVDLVLQPGCTLRVTVVDADGVPVRGVQAVCVDSRGAPISMMLSGMEAMQRSTQFLTGGEQTLGPLAPGEYRVVLAEVGAKTVSHEVTVPPGVPELRLTLAFPR